jgi:hypothetical protein
MTYRDDYRTVSREVRWSLPRIMLWIGVFMLIFFGLGLLARSLGFIGNVASQPARIISKTLDADNVIYNYEWFKRQHEAIGAVERQIPIAEQQANTARARAARSSSFSAEQEDMRAEAILQGLRNQRENYIAEYNARSRMANRNIFKGSDLPERIEP